MVQRYADLLAERTNDPLTRGLAAASDDDATAAMNAIDRPAPVPVREVVDYLLLVDKWVAVQDSTGTPARNFAVRLLGTVVDFMATDVLRDVAGLVSDGVLDQRGADGLLALGENRQSRGQEIGVGQVRNRDWGRMRIEHIKRLI